MGRLVVFVVGAVTGVIGTLVAQNRKEVSKKLAKVVEAGFEKMQEAYRTGRTWLDSLSDPESPMGDQNSSTN